MKLNIINIHRDQFLPTVFIWWLFFACFSFGVFGIHNFFLSIIGFPFLVLVPGYMTTRILRLEAVSNWGIFILSISFSLLELILTGLISNTFLPYFGILHPLGKHELALELNTLLVVLSVLYVKFCNKESLPLKINTLTRSGVLHFVTVFFSAALTALSILGAIRLNNGASGTWTLIMLVGMGIFFAYLIWKLFAKEDHYKEIIPVILFFSSLALLFMTSLRGWYTTGHDIQLEYRVFELTNQAEYWSINYFHDAYNACMSITLLPTIFLKLLNISDPYVYKILFQIIFAAVPGTIYVIISRYVSSAVALLSSLYFISFPTFFGDMPFLNRQEIAFVYLVSMIYVLFEEKLSLKKRRGLFVLFGIGMVLSHYSTTYTVIALLLFVVLGRSMLIWFKKHRFFFGAFTHVSKSGLYAHEEGGIKLITVSMLATLVFASFMWSSVLTDTSSGSISRVILKTIAIIRDNSKEDARSSDVFYSIFSWGKIDPKLSLENYEKNIVQEARKNAPIGTYYNEQLYEIYRTEAVGDRNMPLTALGTTLEEAGINIPKFNYLFRQTSARVLQVLIIIGLLYSLQRGVYNTKSFEVEYELFAIGSLIMIAAQVLLPVLSAEYGVLRAFQQSLLFLGVFVVVGSCVLFSKFTYRVRVGFSSVLLIVFFYSTTGVFTQALGGYPAQLHLNNSGTYYDSYYTHESELSAIRWLMIETPKTQGARIQSDRFEYQSLHSVDGASLGKGIYPGLIERDAYVFLGYSNIKEKVSSFVWNGNAVVYRIPKGFFDDTKDLLYNNGQSAVYK